MALVAFVCEGSAIDYTPSSAVAAGDVVVQADLIGVASSPSPPTRPARCPSAVCSIFPRRPGPIPGSPPGSKPTGTRRTSRPRRTTKAGPTS